MNHYDFPSQFRSLVWRLENQPDAIIDWVVRRSWPSSNDRGVPQRT
jgi:hypothetical protein